MSNICKTGYGIICNSLTACSYKKTTTENPHSFQWYVDANYVHLMLNSINCHNPIMKNMQCFALIIMIIITLIYSILFF